MQRGTVALPASYPTASYPTGGTAGTAVCAKRWAEAGSGQGGARKARQRARAPADEELL